MTSRLFWAVSNDQRSNLTALVMFFFCMCFIAVDSLFLLGSVKIQGIKYGSISVVLLYLKNLWMGFHQLLLPNSTVKYAASIELIRTYHCTLVGYIEFSCLFVSYVLLADILCL